MIVNIKIFHEKTDADYETYNKQWNENNERIIFLQEDLPLAKQMSIIKNDMTTTKDILAIRFPSIALCKKNKIINNIIFGKGVMYDKNKIWYPNEVWMYMPFP